MTLYRADRQDSQIESIYAQLEQEFGAVTYEAWLALLVCFLTTHTNPPANA